MIYGLIGLLIGVAAGIAVLVIRGRSRGDDEIPEVAIDATVTRTYESERLEGNFDYEPDYHVEFEDSRQQRIRFTVDYNTYLAAVRGQYGKLTYRGGSFISFEVDPNGYAQYRPVHRHFFQSDSDSGGAYGLFGQLPAQNVIIDSSEPLSVSYEEVKTLYLHGDFSGDSFFGIEDPEGEVVQFSFDLAHGSIVIDVPDVQARGSYQAVVSEVTQILPYIDAFFEGMNVADTFDMDFIKW